MRRTGVVLACVLTSLLLTVATSGAASGSPRPVVLVPLANVDASVVGRAAAVLRNELGLRVRVAQAVAIPASARDSKRNQFVADRLVAQIRRVVPEASDGRSAVIGLTTEDIYPLHSGWQWAFASRSGSVGVVSLARMDSGAFGLESNPGLSARRLHKYVIRYGALLGLGQSETTDPRSPLYDSIVSTDDLDFMESQFPVPPLTAARKQWLRRTELGCHVAGQAWETVFKTLNTATADQVPGLFQQWFDADTALAAVVLPRAAGAPTPRALVLVAALRGRATYVLDLVGAPLPLSPTQLKHLQSLDSTIRSAMFEIGSKTCASETTT
jgi:predicted Zn-dependent protease